MSPLRPRSTRRGMLAGTVGLLLASRAGLRAGPPDRVEFLLAWGERGDGPGQFRSPVHVAVNAADEVYVADLNNARIQRFTADGAYLSQFPLPLDAPPRKSCIVGGLAVDERGLIYVSFMNQHRIAVYDDAGAVVREWGRRGGGEGEFNQPGGMVLRRDGTLFAADQCNHRVQHFTRDGRFLGAWGGHGSEPGRFGGSDPAGSRFAGPHFLGQDREGRLYTTEAGLGRVQQLAPDGRPLKSWGDKGDQPGGFGALNFGSLAGTYGPIGLALDRRDRVWVSSLNDRVQCYTPEGRYLFGIVEAGPEPGRLDHPHGLAFDGRGRLYVADSSNQRIQKFAIPDP